jgi:hypothetical protein
MADGNESLGKTSLWSSIIGVALPGCLAVLVAVFIKNEYDRRMPYVICGVIFGMLELVALGCGLATRRTATGKAGLVISSVLFVLLLILVGLVFFGYSTG